MRDTTPRYSTDGRTVAVLFDPDGGEHVCYELSDGKTWAAGMVDASAERLADRIWRNWDEPSAWDAKYERQERAFTERFE